MDTRLVHTFKSIQWILCWSIHSKVSHGHSVSLYIQKYPMDTFWLIHSKESLDILFCLMYSKHPVNTLLVDKFLSIQWILIWLIQLEIIWWIVCWFIHSKVSNRCSVLWYLQKYPMDTLLVDIFKSIQCIFHWLINSSGYSVGWYIKNYLMAILLVYTFRCIQWILC